MGQHSPVAAADTLVSDHKYMMHDAIMKEVKTSSSKSLQESVNKNINTLVPIVQLCEDVELLKQINGHISACIHLARIHVNTSSLHQMKCLTKSPATTKIEPQQPFKSNRKHRKHSTIRLAKPSAHDKENIEHALLAGIELYRSTPSEDVIGKIT